MPTQLSTSPITFTYDRALHRRVATFSGSVGDRELHEAYESLLHDATYDPSVDDLIDLRAVTHMGVTGAGLHRLIALYDERPTTGHRTRAAIVAPTDVLYGVSRMFQTLRGDDNPDEVEVFRSVAEAEHWLARHDQQPPR